MGRRLYYRCDCGGVLIQHEETTPLTYRCATCSITLDANEVVLTKHQLCVRCKTTMYDGDHLYCELCRGFESEPYP